MDGKLTEIHLGLCTDKGSTGFDTSDKGYFFKCDLSVFNWHFIMCHRLIQRNLTLPNLQL